MQLYIPMQNIYILGQKINGMETKFPQHAPLQTFSLFKEKKREIASFTYSHNQHKAFFFLSFAILYYNFFVQESKQLKLSIWCQTKQWMICRIFALLFSLFLKLYIIICYFWSFSSLSHDESLGSLNNHKIIQIIVWKMFWIQRDRL